MPGFLRQGSNSALYRQYTLPFVRQRYAIRAPGPGLCLNVIKKPTPYPDLTIPGMKSQDKTDLLAAFYYRPGSFGQFRSFLVVWVLKPTVSRLILRATNSLADNTLHRKIPSSACLSKVPSAELTAFAGTFLRQRLTVTPNAVEGSI